MASIPLSKGMIALIDEADVPLVSGHAWSAGHERNSWYAMAWDSQRSVRMHRLILGLRPGDPHVDHVDTNGLNNQRANLRVASRAQNGMNRRVQPHSSRFKGVSLFRRTGRWMASITVDGEQRYLGSFASEIDAADAYDAAAREAFGPFARTNAGGPHAPSL